MPAAVPVLNARVLSQAFDTVRKHNQPSFETDATFATAVTAAEVSMTFMAPADTVLSFEHLSQSFSTSAVADTACCHCLPTHSTTRRPSPNFCLIRSTTADMGTMTPITTPLTRNSTLQVFLKPDEVRVTNLHLCHDCDRFL